jgi:D-alanyl-D-alanine carboxypeptidase (penicillin-binding protein 5/6)
MPLTTRARAALGITLLVAVIGVSIPVSRGSATKPARTTASSLRSRIPEVGVVGQKAAGDRWSAKNEQSTIDPTPVPTPAPPPPPPPAPPAPPPYGGLHVVTNPQLGFSDASGAHPGAPPTQAGSGILVDTDTHQILWQLNPHQPRPPASTTKILSSLIALNNFDPRKMITITPEALTQSSDETRMGIQAGEQYSVEELLSGMLTVSANDAATAMAVDTVGLDNFVGAMNGQIQALGLHDSHFVTPVGLDDPGQYASAYDLATVALVDVSRFAEFRNIVWRDQVNLPQTATHRAFALPNLNRLLQVYPFAVGIKPGWTGNAGACLVGMAQRNNHHLIAVVMNDPQLYSDETSLFQWGFAQYGIPPA